MLTLGLDIGTTTISIVVVDKENQKIEEAKNILNDSFIKTGYDWEKIQDAEMILKKAEGLLKEFLNRYPKIGSIGLTGQMHGIVYLDREGRSVSPLYTWQYGGAKEMIHEMQDSSVHAGYGMATYYYHHKTEQVPENAVSFCTIMDYLGMYLTGRKRPLMHISNAASLGMFDCKNNCFKIERIAALELDPAMLPDVSAEFETIGMYEGIPVKIAIGDNQASYLGTVGTDTGTVLVNMGTGGQISMLTDRYMEIPGIETRPLSKDKYLLIGASLCGGRAYAVLEKFFRSYASAIGADEKAQYSVMELLASAGKELADNKKAERLEVCTAFSGTRQEPSLRGSICGIGEENFTPELLTYGVLYGMAEELYAMYEKMLEAGCERAERFTASGNGLRKNRILQDIFSEMFEAELILAQFEEEAACGAAFI